MSTAYSIIGIIIVLLGVAFATTLVILTRRAAGKKSAFYDIDRIKNWSKKMRCVCIIALVLSTIATICSSKKLVESINEKTFTTETGITMELQETYDENGEKTYVGKYFNEQGKEFTYYVSEPNNDTSPAWEQLLQIIIAYLVMFAVVCFSINILNIILKDGTPFTDKVSDKLLSIGTILLTSGITSQTIVAIIMHLTDFCKPGTDITFFSLNITQILIGLLIYLISVIFRYGSRLQKTEDEMI